MTEEKHAAVAGAGAVAEGAAGLVVAAAPHVGKALKHTVTGVGHVAGHVGNKAIDGAVAGFETAWENKHHVANAAAAGAGKAVQGVKIIGGGVGKAAGAIAENHETIIDGGVAILEGGHQTLTCCQAFLWNHSCHILRPYCSHCGKGLSGGCGSDWSAFKYPGCDHLICQKCHDKRDSLAPCMKCVAKHQVAEARRKRQESCCYSFFTCSWLFHKEPPKKVELGYHNGYMATKDVMEKLLPALAKEVASTANVSEEKVLETMTSKGSREYLSQIALGTCIPVQLK